MRINNRLDILGLERDAATHKNTEAIKTEVQATRYQVSSIRTNVQEVESSVQQVCMQNHNISVQLNRIGSSMQHTSANLEKYVEASVARQFEQWKKEFDLGLGNMKKEYQDNAAGIIQTFMYQFMGEKMYAEHPTPLLQETQNILRQSTTMQPDGLAKVRTLVSMDQFLNFVTTPYPNVLLVDGYCRESGIGRTSPLSIFCASLAATLAYAESNIVLHFFCEHHGRPNDPICGPGGLLRSLITQMILYPNAMDSRSVSMEPSMWDATNNFDVSALLGLFEQILFTLSPSKTLHIILDNISAYQSALHTFHAPTLQIIRNLHHLATTRRSGPQIKLFMTSAGRTMNVPNLVNEQGGEYLALRTSARDERPTRGRAFEQDIRSIMQRPDSGPLLSPFNRESRLSGEQIYHGNPAMERSRSASRYI
ncbi:hypothetical protein N0V90_003425 [Kalmusia sp. IMI 367209]|nr:hypothetical protein N0V90_003425 [Kalmusia sp. IMI 367209]